jgi:WD40 repeat protein
MPRIKPTSKRILDPKSLQQWIAQLDDYVNSLAWSPDGKWLAAASVSGPITIFAGKSGQVLHVLDGHDFGTCEVGWNASGTTLASVGQDGHVRLWDPETGQERFKLPGGASWVEHLAWSPEGDLLATTAGRKLCLWNGANGQLLQDYPDQSSTISDVSWQPGKQVLTSTAYGSITFWQPDRNEPIRSLEWKGSILVMAWSPDGNYIATGDQDATVHFWITRTGQDLQMHGYPTKVRELSWDGTSRYLATGGSPTVTIWDCSGKGPEGSKPIELKGHTTLLSALAFQHRGKLIASASTNGTLMFWQIDKPKRPLVQASLGSGISQLTWSPDNRLIAVGTEAGGVSVYGIPQAR